jgi:hypothetical protein
MTFGFTDGTPMAFAQAAIYGPSDRLPFLETTTDRAGRVSFLPDRDGTWRAEATDAEGHHLMVTASLAAGVPLGAGKGVPDALVAGSLVLNLILVSLFAARWRRRTARAMAI